MSKDAFIKRPESRQQATKLSAEEVPSCVPRALWGWSPPPLPAQTAWARRVDRLLPRTGPRCLMFIVGVVALLEIAPHLSPQGQLGVDGIAFLAAGSWCGLNFWRCRHAHCVVSGGGWLSLSILAFIEMGLGHSLIDGYEQPAFLGILAIGVAFEGAWYLRHGNNAVVGRRDRPTGIGEISQSGW